MATKKITDLQLISSVTSGLSIPTDNGIQSYRFTAAQMLAYIMGAGNVPLTALDLSIFNGLTAVTPALDDYLTLIDTSDSNKTKKATVGSFLVSATRAVSSLPATATSTDQTVRLSGASGTFTLPTAVSADGRRIKIIHAGTSLSQVYTIGTTSSQTIGGISGGSYALYTVGEVLEVESDGANWIVSHRISNSIKHTWTPTIVGWNSTANLDFSWWRVGTHAHFHANWTGGTSNGSTISISMPTGMASATTGNLGGGGLEVICWLGFGGNSASMRGLGVGPGATAFNGVVQDSGNNSLAQCSGNTFGSSNSLCGTFAIPISGWQP